MVAINIERGIVAEELSAHRARNPAVPGSSPALRACSISSRGLSEFISSATLVNSQLIASCQLGFLILLCCISVIVPKYLTGRGSASKLSG